MAGRRLAVVLILSLAADAFSLPAERWRRDSIDNEIGKDSVTSSSEIASTTDEEPKINTPVSPEVYKDVFGGEASDNSPRIAESSTNDKPKPVDSFEDDDDDFGDAPMPSGGGGGGSNIFSLLKLVGALFPSASGNNIKTRKMIQNFVIRNQLTLHKLGNDVGDYLRKSQDYKKYPTYIKVEIERGEPKGPINSDQFFRENQIMLKQVQKDFSKLSHNRMQRRQDIADNVIDIDYTVDLKPPSVFNPSTFQRQETNEEDDSENSESQASESESHESETEEEDKNKKNDAAEESVEDNKTKSKEDSDTNGDGDNDANSDEDDDSDEFDSDEPPEGNGGGILGLLAGLSGGEDGQSDLGSLLATVSGIVASLSGDGIDINALIGSGIGLFVGLLSQENENAGEVLASYLLTSLDTLSGGGAKNNGEFFGKFLSKLIKGTSAGGDPDASSEENGNGNGMTMTDSAGFFTSFLMGILGDMSKGSSGGGSW